MYAKAAAYQSLSKNLWNSVKNSDPVAKQQKKSGITAERNTSSGG